MYWKLTNKILDNIIVTPNTGSDTGNFHGVVKIAKWSSNEATINIDNILDKRLSLCLNLLISDSSATEYIDCNRK